MDSRSLAPGHFALSVAWRVLAASGLAYLVIRLLAVTHLYATALVVAGIAALLIADIARTVSRAHRSTEQLLEALASGVAELFAQNHAGHARSAAPFQRATTMINAARAEQQRQLEHLRALLDTVAAALIILRPDGRVVLVNRAARRLAAARVDRLDEIAAVGGPAARFLRDLAPGARQIVRLADGQAMHVSVAQFSVPGREPERLISLQRIAGELDAVELKAWQDMARVLAHEMMNSLTPISSLAESLEVLLRDASRRGTLEMDSSSGEIAGALEAIKRRSHGLMSFVERYRAVAELPQPRMQSIRMDKFLAGIERLMSATFKDKAISFQSHVAPQELLLHADPELLEQALINLLRNATDAVSAVTQPRVEISCQLQDGQVTLAVADNGRGLTDNERDQIFVPFFTSKAGGSGIGLSVARQVALAHGGQLEVHSNDPQGSVFSLTLPSVGEPSDSSTSLGTADSQ